MTRYLFVAASLFLGIIAACEISLKPMKQKRASHNSSMTKTAAKPKTRDATAVVEGNDGVRGMIVNEEWLKRYRELEDAWGYADGDSKIKDLGDGHYSIPPEVSNHFNQIVHFEYNKRSEQKPK